MIVGTYYVPMSEFYFCIRKSRVGVGYGVVDRKRWVGVRGGRLSNSEIRYYLCQTKFYPVLTRLSSLLSTSSTTDTYIFTAPTCTTTIITSNLAH
jgi:hypothetical protein